MILIPYKIVVRKKKFLLDGLHGKPFFLVGINPPWIASGLIISYNNVERYTRPIMHCVLSR